MSAELREKLAAELKKAGFGGLARIGMLAVAMPIIESASDTALTVRTAAAAKMCDDHAEELIAMIGQPFCKSTAYDERVRDARCKDQAYTARICSQRIRSLSTSSEQAALDQMISNAFLNGALQAAEIALRDAAIMASQHDNSAAVAIGEIKTERIVQLTEIRNVDPLREHDQQVRQAALRKAEERLRSRVQPYIQFGSDIRADEAEDCAEEVKYLIDKPSTAEGT